MGTGNPAWRCQLSFSIKIQSKSFLIFLWCFLREKLVINTLYHVQSGQEQVYCWLNYWFTRVSWMTKMELNMVYFKFFITNYHLAIDVKHIGEGWIANVLSQVYSFPKWLTVPWQYFNLFTLSLHIAFFNFQNNMFF